MNRDLVVPASGSSAAGMDVRVGTLDSYWKDNAHYQWALDAELDLFAVRRPQDAISKELDLVVTLDNYHTPAVGNALELKKLNIPVLTLADGILEYRNTFEHPQLVAGALFQPVLGHKIACISRSQARVLESWGNLGKCEIVGMPRLDALIGRKPRVRSAGEPFRILIMTAKTAGFTPEQLHCVIQSLKDLRDAVTAFLPLDGMSQIEPVWRLTGSLQEDVGIPNTGGAELASVLETVDAVITTPSTAMLEGMLQGIPVAVLDYNNCPHYVAAAWSITAQNHIMPTIHQLQSQPQAKMLYQQMSLYDNLECRTPAAHRMVQLVEKMAKIGRECRRLGHSLEFPRRLLKDGQDGHHLPEESFDMRRLYPDHPVFANMDRVLLQIEVSHLKQELEAPGEELVHLRDVIEAYETSFSLRLGRILTWPFRVMASKSGK